MKQFQKSCLLGCALLLSASSVLRAQMYVDTENEVGVGTLSPGAKLEIVTTSATHGTALEITNSTTGGTMIGIKNTLQGNQSLMYGIRNYITQSTTATNRTYGVYTSVAGNSNQSCYGAYTTVSTSTGSSAIQFGNYITVGTLGSGVKYGIYSETAGSNNYAGFFAGNVTVTGTLSYPSDARTKQNIRPLESALSTIGRLQPRIYEYRQDLRLHLPEGPQYGFVAQDLEKVLPALVHEINCPLAADAANPDADPESMTIKGVNYAGLIPVLTQAMQELKAQVDAQALQIEALQAELAHK